MNEEVLEEWMCDINGYTLDAFPILKTGLMMSFISIADVWFCSIPCEQKFHYSLKEGKLVYMYKIVEL